MHQIVSDLDLVHEPTYSIPNGHLAQQVILQLELLHLPIPYGTIFRVKEVPLDLVPRARVLVSQRDLHPARNVLSALELSNDLGKGLTGFVQELQLERSHRLRPRFHSTS